MEALVEEPRVLTAKEVAAKRAADLADASEASRVARRVEARRAIAASQVAEARLGALVQLIAEAQAEHDNLATKHEAECEPIQRELREIENQQIEGIVAGQTSDPSREDYRRKLLADLAHKNGVLEGLLERSKGMIDNLERQRIAAATEVDGCLHVNVLYKTMSPEQSIRLKSLNSAVHWAQRRVDFAEETVQKMPASTYWRDELKAAQHHLEHALTEFKAAEQSVYLED